MAQVCRLAEKCDPINGKDRKKEKKKKGERRKKRRRAKSKKMDGKGDVEGGSREKVIIDL